MVALGGGGGVLERHEPTTRKSTDSTHWWGQGPHEKTDVAMPAERQSFYVPHRLAVEPLPAVSSGIIRARRVNMWDTTQLRISSSRR